MGTGIQSSVVNTIGNGAIVLGSANLVSITGTYSVGAADVYILFGGASSYNIQLPNPALGRRVLYFVDVGVAGIGNAESFPKTLVLFSGEKIGGVASNKVLGVNGGSWGLLSDLTNWTPI